jgi:molybdopterin/thiamine biosynthesis adenylyltransferase
LILAGPNTVTICDDNLVTWGDLATNFFAKEKDVGKTSRAASVLQQLKELNPMVSVNTFSGEVGPNALAGYHVCVVTESYD